MNTSELHITIIDDHPILLDGLRLLLLQAGYGHISCLSSDQDICNYINNPSGDIIILDINMGKHNGLDLLNGTLSKRPEAKIIMLSSYSDTRLIREAIKHGAKGYLTKQTASKHIIDAVQSVGEGGTYFDPIIQEIINKSFAHVAPDVVTTSERPMQSMLSDREQQVLELIRAEYTSEEIAKELYISKSTVDTYRKNLIKKLMVRNSVGLAKE
jgi:DNA-binding NarL/FixJ family response regulator